MNGKTKSSTDSDPGQTTVDRLTAVAETLRAAQGGIVATWRKLDGASPDTCLMIGQSAGMMSTAIALLCRDIDRLSGFKDEGP